MRSTLIKLLLALGGLTACDPSLRMVFRNSTGRPAQLTMFGFQAGRPDTTTHYPLPPGRTVLHFGIGGWTDSTTYRVARRHFKQWELASAGDTLRLQSHSVYEFLRRCPRKGLTKGLLLVDVK